MGTTRNQGSAKTRRANKKVGRKSLAETRSALTGTTDPHRSITPKTRTVTRPGHAPPSPDTRKMVRDVNFIWRER